MHRQNSPFIMLVHVDSAHLAWPHAKSINQQIAPINQLLKLWSIWVHAAIALMNNSHATTTTKNPL